MISLIGGKLTTAASVARECARKLGVFVAEPDTALVAPAPADGVEAGFRQWAKQISRVAGINADSARAIAEWHGRGALQIARLAAKDELLRATLCPHSDHLVAEVLVAFRVEHAANLADVLLRRVPVAFSACWSEECSRTAAKRVGRAMGWTEAEVLRGVEDFEQERRAFLQPAVLEKATSEPAGLPVAST